MKKDDIGFYKDYGLFLLEMLMPSGKSLDNHSMAKSLKESYADLIMSCYQGQKKNVLKKFIAELELQAKMLDPLYANPIKVEVFNKFGIRLGNDAELKKINAIVKRGYIKTEAEYRLLKDNYDLVTTENSGLADKIGVMLDTYDMSN